MIGIVRQDLTRWWSMFLRTYFSDSRVLLLLSVFILLILSVIFVYSTGFVVSIGYGVRSSYFFEKHLIALLISLGAMYAGYLIPVNSYKRYIPFLYFFTVSLLISVFFFPPIKGAYRWIDLPFFNFQPSEFAKFMVILYLAYYLDKKGDDIGSFLRGFLPASILLGILTSLILIEPDYGTTLTIIIVGFAMYLMGGIRLTHLGGMLAFVLPVMISAVLTVGYRSARLFVFLDPWQDMYGHGYQLVQSLISVGSGGFFGKGIGNSVQKLYFLPEAHNDFIFAIISEEIGFVLSTAVVLVILFIFKLCTDIAFSYENKFNRLLIFGIGLLFFVESMLHILVVLGLLPTKGTTLPFVSYGGSSMLMSLFMVGVVLSASSNRDDDSNNISTGGTYG